MDRTPTGSRMAARTERTVPASLYDPRFEHDACGVGFVARASGIPDHGILEMALEAVKRLSHRGAVAADGLSGDGAGVLTQIPRRLFLRESGTHGWGLSPDRSFAIGMVFLPRGVEGPEAQLADHLEAQELRVAGWRTVPVDATALGESARATSPRVRQVVVTAPTGLTDELFERRLYLARKAFERSGADG